MEKQKSCSKPPTSYNFLAKKLEILGNTGPIKSQAQIAAGFAVNNTLPTHLSNPKTNQSIKCKMAATPI